MSKLKKMHLRKGETWPNPVSTKSEFHGPGYVEYREWPDGGIDLIGWTARLRQVVRATKTRNQ